jgi:hypothetical protein
MVLMRCKSNAFYLQAEGGVKTFFKGYVPSLVRAVPVNSAIFMAVFQVKSLMANDE